MGSEAATGFAPGRISRSEPSETFLSSGRTAFTLAPCFSLALVYFALFLSSRCSFIKIERSLSLPPPQPQPARKSAESSFARSLAPRLFVARRRWQQTRHGAAHFVAVFKTGRLLLQARARAASRSRARWGEKENCGARDAKEGTASLGLQPKSRKVLCRASKSFPKVRGRHLMRRVYPAISRSSARKRTLTLLTRRVGRQLACRRRSTENRALSHTLYVLVILRTLSTFPPLSPDSFIFCISRSLHDNRDGQQCEGHSRSRRARATTPFLPGESSRATHREEFLRKSPRPIDSYFSGRFSFASERVSSERARSLARCKPSLFSYNPFNVTGKSYRRLTDCRTITVPESRIRGSDGSFRDPEPGRIRHASVGR